MFGAAAGSGRARAATLAVRPKLVKNALDYTEDMRNDPAVYLDGRAVGCITCAYGPQAAGTTLVALRSIVHALRGWPTPLGVGINSASCRFSPGEEPSDAAIADQLKILATQVIQGAFAMRAGLAAAWKPGHLVSVA
ncbi:FMN reductase [Sinorhizobium fredii]|uniref:NADPH-dependent FMN reductase family protein n=2 Tax=Rhizobium fredii TaxID=380 RepID=I3X4S0_SINF2|nr:NADPH-dependent FMN reductase family protein [Sinorhizobium fredii USDA 257]